MGPKQAPHEFSNFGFWNPFGTLLGPILDPFETLLRATWLTFGPIWDPLGPMGPFGTGPRDQWAPLDWPQGPALGTHGPLWDRPQGPGPWAPFGPIGPSGPK